MDYDNTNAGAIFKNETASGNQPTYRGNINVDGIYKQIAMCVNQTNDCKPFFSVKISEPYNAELPTTQAPKPQQKDEIDSLPF